MSADPELIEFLKGRDVECPVCRYNLRDGVSPACPECGKELRLVLVCAQNVSPLWVTLTSFAAGGAGLGLWLGFVSIRFGHTPNGHGPVLDALMACAIIALVTMIPVTAAAVLGRKRFHQLSASVQRRTATLIIGAVSLSVASIIIWLVG